MHLEKYNNCTTIRETAHSFVTKTMLFTQLSFSRPFKYDPFDLHLILRYLFIIFVRVYSLI